jgi:hypothetical protein
MIKQPITHHGLIEAPVAGQPLGVPKSGSWRAALDAPEKKLSLDWTAESEAKFQRLPGWKAPLWRMLAGRLELLRPEGRWVANIQGAPESFVLRQEGAHGWLSGRGVPVSLKSMEGVWFDQHGIAQSIDRLDAEAQPPVELAGLVQASGQWARWELTPEGKALGWLDDSFEHGPFSVRDHKPYLVVSDGEKMVAYWMGETHWAWPMVERGLLLVCTGRGGGWETERAYAPVLI